MTKQYDEPLAIQNLLRAIDKLNDEEELTVKEEDYNPINYFDIIVGDTRVKFFFGPTQQDALVAFMSLLVDAGPYKLNLETNTVSK